MRSGIAVLKVELSVKSGFGERDRALQYRAWAVQAGLTVIAVVENDRRASEVAEVDAALLTDDLPPAAYADPGFTQFLRLGGTD